MYVVSRGIIVVQMYIVVLHSLINEHISMYIAILQNPLLDIWNVMNSGRYLDVTVILCIG